MKFKILRGMYSDNDPLNGSRRIYKGYRNKDNNDYTGDGDIIETSTDLVKRFNMEGYPPKFVQVSDSEQRKHSETRAGRKQNLGKVEAADIQTAATTATLDPPQVDTEDLRSTLEAMHHKTLKKYAESNGYDIEGATSIEEMVNMIMDIVDTQ